jgi:hypothetical protein
MESFYGGRMGASFIIVKQFDGLDIPLDKSDNPSDYKIKEYAYKRIENKDYYIYIDNNFIEKNSDNEDEYSWKEQELDGSLVDVVLSEIPPYEYKTVKLETRLNTAFKIKIYATNGDTSNLHFLCTEEIIEGNPVYSFIEKTGDNYKDYAWKAQPLNGRTVSIEVINSSSASIPTEKTLSKVNAEGMRQCFEQGGATTDIVNYGEYVIIDTFKGIGEKSNPDNGKVYRRGMNYDYDPIKNPLAGAEYIGQIVGPKGDTPEVSIEHYENIIQKPNSETGTYTETSEDLIPGAYKDNSDEWIFNDNIEYGYVNVQDEYGNISGAWIGFKIPTLVDDFYAESASPYYNRDETTKIHKNLITPDEEQFVDGKWTHPFYQKWQIKIPQGYHGTDSIDLELVHTKTMPKGYKKNYKGVFVWTNEDCTTPYIVEDSQLCLEQSQNILIDTYDDVKKISEYNIIYDPSSIGCKINYNDQILYVKKEDCYMDELRYREINWDNEEQGELKFIRIGEYNNIQRVTLSENGVLTAYYSAITEPQQLKEAIRWIDNTLSPAIPKDMDWYELDPTTSVISYKKSNDLKIENKNYYTIIPTIAEPKNPLELSDCYEYNVAEKCYKKTADIEIKDKIYYTLAVNQVSDPSSIRGIVLDREGTVTVYYNTLDDQNPPQHEKVEFKNALTWIVNTSIDSETGKFKILFNNDSIPSYETTLKYIEDVAIQTNKLTKDPETGEIIDSGEGSGDQMMYITYTTDPEPVQIKGKPLNYIIESTIVTDPSVVRTIEEIVIDPETGEPVIDPETGEPETTITYINMWGHLLIRFSDPAYRLKFKELWVTYYSQKEEKNYTEWIDMGDVHGADGGLKFITEVYSYNELKDDQDKWIPPELLTDKNTGEIINPNAVGWNVAYTYQEYQQVSSEDIFDETKIYYVKDANDKYVEDDSVNENNFAEKVAEGLYIEFKAATEVLYFDYQVDNNNDYLGWKTLGTIDSSAIDPAKVIVLTAKNGNPGNVNDGGFWLVYETIKSAY